MPETTLQLLRLIVFYRLTKQSTRLIVFYRLIKMAEKPLRSHDLLTRHDSVMIRFVSFLSDDDTSPTLAEGYIPLWGG